MKQRESAILHMSDLHFGKVTTSYNPEVCITRLDKLGESLRRIRSLLSDYQFDELVLAMTGDMNDGSGIYPTQVHHQTISNVEKQADLLSDILTEFAREQKKIWGQVRIEAVPGNHGRAGPFLHEAANWDMVLYHYLSKQLKSAGIKVGVSDDANVFLRKITVRTHKYLLFHGHSIRMYQQLPWYGISQRLLRWNNSSLAPFDALLMGHFHACGEMPINNIPALLSGTMVSDDDWALQELGMETEPRWWLFGVSDHKPITWQFRLSLT